MNENKDELKVLNINSEFYRAFENGQSACLFATEYKMCELLT